MKNHRRAHAARLVAALVVAGVLFAIATAVEAAIPDPAGTIHGCYAKTSQGASPAGALRVIDIGIGQVCNPNEVGLNWSQTGPKGATGPKGSTGPKGATGPKGTTGAQGPAGAGPAFANYSPFITMQPIDNKILAGVVLPVGTYTLSGQVRIEYTGDTDISCLLESSGTVHQAPGWTGQVQSFSEVIHPIIGDVTITVPNTSVLVVCSTTGTDTLGVEGSLIATQVSSVTVQQ